MKLKQVYTFYSLIESRRCFHINHISLRAPHGPPVIGNVYTGLNEIWSEFDEYMISFCYTLDKEMFIGDTYIN